MCVCVWMHRQLHTPTNCGIFVFLLDLVEGDQVAADCCQCKSFKVIIKLILICEGACSTWKSFNSKLLWWDIQFNMMRSSAPNIRGIHFEFNHKKNLILTFTVGTPMCRQPSQYIVFTLYSVDIFLFVNKSNCRHTFLELIYLTHQVMLYGGASCCHYCSDVYICGSTLLAGQILLVVPDNNYCSSEYLITCW